MKKICNYGPRGQVGKLKPEDWYMASEASDVPSSWPLRPGRQHVIGPRGNIPDAWLMIIFPFFHYYFEDMVEFLEFSKKKCIYLITSIIYLPVGKDIIFL